jgi:competence ComEA-like helix-hairpin-helix protein
MALLVLLGSTAALAVARWEETQHPPKAVAAQRPQLAEDGEGARLRDGRGIDPNRATAEELELLPGVGPSLAKRIVAERAAGPFKGPRDLRRVKGIGEKTLKRLEPWLRFGSEQIEHTAQSQLGLRHGAHPGGLPEDARP